MTEQEFNQKVKLIGLLGSAFHQYGTNAQRLEASLNHLTKSLGLNGNFFSTPTYLTISINSGEDQITRHIRSVPTDINLEKLQDIDTLAEKIIKGSISHDEATLQLKELEQRKPSYHSIITLLAFSLTSMSLSVIFGGNLIDAMVSFFIGSIVGIIGILKGSYTKISDSFEFLASFFVSMLSCLVFHYIVEFDYQNVIISSLIVIIPGITVTIAMNELASHHLVSGTARFMGSMIGLLKISFGVFLAAQTNLLLFSNIVSPQSAGISPWFIIPAMLITSVTFTIIFCAKKSDYIWVLLSGILTFGSLKLLNQIFSDVLSLFMAAFMIGIFSNLFSKLRNRPSLITLLPGIIFLVPGSLGIKGLNLIFNHNIIEGINTSIQMFILSITIVTGLLIANIFLSPRDGL
ncbi:MAG: threonine/serine exporter family protein [Halobacteriovoraceae bacterium]|jgi:uncharacterized membrane protein YjjP (DUF1212 family)|nr:threonine/serine exporter family protein [Halobacteriovoraceae bacterium]